MAELDHLRAALESYRIGNGAFPPAESGGHGGMTLDGLRALHPPYNVSNGLLSPGDLWISVPPQ